MQDPIDTGFEALLEKMGEEVVRARLTANEWGALGFQVLIWFHRPEQQAAMPAQQDAHEIHALKDQIVHRS